MSLSVWWNEANRNVRIVLVFSLVWILGRGLWENIQLPAFVKLLAHDDTQVGLVTSLAGIVQMIFAIPAGMLADRSRRDILLRFASAIGIAAIVCSAIAVMNESTTMLYWAMALWGLVYALNDSPMESLFADSTTTGSRARIFAIKHTMVQLGQMGSMLFSAVLFIVIGNNWTMPSLKEALLIGFVFTVLPVIMMALLNDDQGLARDSEAAQDLIDNRAAASAAAAAAADRQRNLSTPLLSRQPHHHQSRHLQDPGFVHTRLLSLPINRLPSFRHIAGPSLEMLSWAPFVVAATDILTGFGAGATVRFFPLFYKNEFSLSPVSVALLLAVSPLLTAIMSLLGQHWAITHGRARTILTLHLSGAIFMFAFSVATDVFASMFLFTLMNALMNSIKPLKRSILMDVVPKSKRGLWNAFESFTKSSWSGSAVLGGLLIDAVGYRTCFLLIAVLYVFASLPVFMLHRMRIDTLIQEACDDDGEYDDDEHAGGEHGVIAHLETAPMPTVHE